MGRWSPWARPMARREPLVAQPRCAALRSTASWRCCSAHGEFVPPRRLSELSTHISLFYLARASTELSGGIGVLGVRRSASGAAAPRKKLLASAAARESDTEWCHVTGARPGYFGDVREAMRSGLSKSCWRMRGLNSGRFRPPIS